MRTCRVCNRVKTDGSFDLLPSGYRRRKCGACRQRTRIAKKPEAYLAGRSRYREQNPAVYITADSRNADRKRGLAGNDLTTEFVALAIEDGCVYCGETTLRMTLDRIDNDKAHTMLNVVPSCIRCNYLRGSMPYAAWLHMVPAVREARELGLFGDWRARPFNLKVRNSLQ